MKYRFLICTPVIGLLAGLSLPSAAQTCHNGAALATFRYDSVAFGTGNSSQTITFPKFDPALGILMGVKLNADVSMEYSYEENLLAISFSGVSNFVCAEMGSAIQRHPG